MSATPKTIVSVIERHQEDAAFLSTLCSRAVGYASFGLKELQRLDERLEAHLDGLRIAGDDGWRICEQTLAEWPEPGTVFVAAVLACEQGDARRLAKALETALASPENARGFASALGWLPWNRAESTATRLLASEVPSARQLAIAAFAAHRRDPGERSLCAAIQDEDHRLRARALKAVGQLGRTELLTCVRPEYSSADACCRFWAAWAGAILGDRAAVPSLCQIVETGGEFAEAACATAVRRMSVGERHAWIDGLGQCQERHRLTATAAAAAGDSAYVPWLILQMRTPHLSRVAGEAFTFITGIDLALAGLEGQRPQGFQAGPTENPDDENVALDEDEHLPWPNPDAVTAWWMRHGSNFAPEIRHLLGKPIALEWLSEVLRQGRQRHRAAAAMELAMLQPGQPLFDVRAPAHRQMAMLGIDT